VVVTNCSNNYGPYHFPEKLIPLTILNALAGNRCRSTATGAEIRDWLYVEDHARALYKVATEGRAVKRTTSAVITSVKILMSCAPSAPFSIKWLNRSRATSASLPI
jgi:dTDP-D-glucose 4,6-dehydratase